MSSNSKNSPPGNAAPASGSSYGQILKSSSIVGGAQGINYVIGLVRTKVVAVLLGPSGVGLVGLYMSIISLVQTAAQMGIDQSGVRDVAQAAGTGDQQRVAKTVRYLRRLCWLTGALGWILTVAFSWPLTVWTFGSGEHVWAVAILGSVILLEAVAGGQKALLQGVRRIGDLARLQVASAVLTTIIAIGIYAALKERGIVPVIILTSAVQLGCSWFYSRRICLEPVHIRWSDLWAESKHMVALGSTFMYGALLAALAAFIIRALIVRDLGLDAAGIYQAAWVVSGMFAGFILQAMGMDFYPRLASIAGDDKQISRLVNEQIEAGLLMALPFILSAIATASLLVKVFFSAKFALSAVLVPWFVVGVLGQMVSWPIGMILTAKAATGWLYFSRTHGAILQVGLTFVLFRMAGLPGVAWAFAAYVWLQNLLVQVIGRRLVGFKFTGHAWKILWLSVALSAIALVIVSFCPQPWGSISVLALAGASAIVSVRELADRVGRESKIGRVLHKLTLRRS